MPNPIDPETLKIPAFMRNKAIVSQSKQKLILTALDRKEAGLKPNSTRAMATVKKSASSKYNQVLNDIANGRKEAKLSQTPRRIRHKYTRRKSALSTAHSQLSAPVDFSTPESLFTMPLLDDDAHTPSFAQQYAPPSSKYIPQPIFAAEQQLPTFPEKLLAAGTITHYLPKIDVAIIKLTYSLKIGDFIYISSQDGLFLQQITEMQIDRRPVLHARAGDHIGLKVNEPAQIEGKIFKIE